MDKLILLDHGDTIEQDYRFVHGMTLDGSTIHKQIMDGSHQAEKNDITTTLCRENYLEGEGSVGASC